MLNELGEGRIFHRNVIQLLNNRCWVHFRLLSDLCLSVQISYFYAQNLEVAGMIIQLDSGPESGFMHWRDGLWALNGIAQPQNSGDGI